MPNVIDSIVVELGLDGASMAAGTRKAQGDYKRLRDDATKTGKDLSDAGKRGAEFFTRMRNEALAFFAVFTAGKGLKAFVSDTVSSNVALGNLSRNLNTSARTLDAWQRTARSFGVGAGSAAELYRSIQSMSQTMSGRLELNRVQALTGVSFTNAQGQLRGMNDILGQLNRTAQGMDPARLQALLGLLGGGQDAATLLEQRNLQQRLAQMTRYAATPQDVRASQELLADWVRLTSQSEQLGRSFLTHLEPGIHATLKGLADWIDKHPEFQRMLDRDATAISNFIQGLNWNQILGDVNSFEKKVEGIDWSSVVSQVKGIRTEVDHVVDALGGWREVTEVILGLWVGSRFLGMLSSLRTVTALLGGGPLAALLSTAGTLAAALMAPAIGVAAGVTAGAAPIGKGDTLAAGGGPADTEAAVRAEARRQGVDPDAAVAIARIESGGRQIDPRTGKTLTSSAGALGIMQVEPGTAPDVNLNDSSQNIRAGVAYFKKLLAQFHGNVQAAAAAYNAGPNNSGVRHYAETGDASQLPPETFSYAAKFATTLAAVRRPGQDPNDGQRRSQSYADMRHFGHEVVTAGDRAGKALHAAIVHRLTETDFRTAFANTDSPVAYSNALLSVASHQGGGQTTTHTTTIHQLTVVTKSTDPHGVAREIKTQLSRPQRLAAVSNTGLQ